jgi:hypothetical protein
MGCQNGIIPGSNFYYPNDSSEKYFIIDTLQNNNLWKIGKSQKPAIGLWRGLMTDTALGYPVNNVSSFKFGVITCDGIGRDINGYWGTSIYFTMGLETDYKHDGLVIETSNNSRENWRNILLDTNVYLSNLFNSFYTINDTISSANKPGFSGGPALPLTFSLLLDPPNRAAFDTTWFRFTFYSDSIHTNKAGFNFESFQIQPIFEGISSESLIELKIHPNPLTELLTIENLPVNDVSTIEIYNISGQLLHQTKATGRAEINISWLEPGLYLIKTGNAQKRVVKY